MPMKPSKYENFFTIGQKFNEWTVVDTAIWPGNDILVECSCGHRKKCSAHALITGRSRSCSSSVHRQGSRNRHWKGTGEISGSWFCYMRRGAKSRGLAWTVTDEYLWELYQKQNGLCALTELKLSVSESKNCGPSVTASLDRIDSAKGYIPGNVQWVHKDVNRMKSTLTMVRLVQLSKLISERFSK